MIKPTYTSAVVVLGFALMMAIAPLPTASAQTSTFLPPQPLSCGVPPCILPNLQISQSPYGMSTQAIVSNPADPNQLVIADLDWTCANTFVAVFSSSDAGATWTHTCLPVQPGLLGGGNPFVAYGLNNVLYAGGGNYDPNDQNKSRIVMSTSLDNGLHWSTPTTVVDWGAAPWLQVDANSGSPFRNNLYFTSLIAHPKSIYVAVSNSSDGGKTWTAHLLDRTSDEHAISIGTGNVAVAPDGTVYTTFLKCKLVVPELGCRTTRIMFSRSSDGGNTWSTPAEIARTIYNQLSGPGELIFPALNPVVSTDNSMGPNSGNIYVAFPRYKPPMLIGVMSSRDGGTTWSAPVPVSKSNIADQFMNWISVASDGTVGVTWLDRRLDKYHYQPYYAISKDGGATFTGDQPLSDFLSDPEVTFDFGAFRTHTWAGNTLHATWIDTRTGIGQIFVGRVQF